LKLPGGDNVEIDQRKLTEYALSPTHPVGKHKARLFALKLGLTRDDAPALIEALRAVAVSNDATATEHDVWGQRYSIDFLFRFDQRSAMLTSGWIVPADGSPTHLTSVYIAREK
jgi:hypothetical protein